MTTTTTTTTDWYRESINALQLNGKAERSQEAYTRALRMLVQVYDKAPEDMTEQKLESYFLHRRSVDRWPRPIRARRLRQTGSSAGNPQ